MNPHNRPSLRPFILFVAVTLSFATRVQATQAPVYVYNSFGPGNSFVAYADWGISGAGNPGDVGHGESFVPGLTGNLDTLQVAVGQLSGGTGLVNFYVAADAGGIPGGVMESFMNVAAPASASLVTMDSITHPLLQAGANYWLYAEPAQNTTTVGWFVNNQGYANRYAQEGPPGVWTSAAVVVGSNGAFDVSVVPVPEPSVMALAIFGLGLFCLRRLR